MPATAANLIPTEESTFNRPGFWEIGGNVEIGGGVMLLNSNGSFIGKSNLLTPGKRYIVILDLAQLNGGNLNVGNIMTGGGADAQSKAVYAPGMYTFEITANDAFFGAIVNAPGAIINSLQVYPAEAYAIPAATPMPVAQKGRGLLFWLAAAGIVYLVARK